VEAAGPGPGLTQFLKGRLIDAHDDQLRGGKREGTQLITEVQAPVFQVFREVKKGQTCQEEEGQ
jgi:hypothetical protein